VACHFAERVDGSAEQRQSIPLAPPSRAPATPTDR
jgi:hypothetical protein